MISISINNQWSVSASTISISMSISNRWSASASMISISINNDCTPRRQSLRHGYLAEIAHEWLKLKINARRSWRSWSYCNATTASRTASSSKNAVMSASMGQYTQILYASRLLLLLWLLLQVRVKRECKKWLGRGDIIEDGTAIPALYTATTTIRVRVNVRGNHRHGFVSYDDGIAIPVPLIKLPPLLLLLRR